ncbi:MAG: prepilin-type N-terminal cleavage/methylation domain-containing protein [Candidatus Staskawiczbacteria bacterium]|nr:prepilin-type N-terminal cleavage/methylation domain-containing protein [Candidatus Staskawiczbacteria bacterium]
MQKDSKNKKGFTIIELMITIFILSFAVVGIFAAFSVMASLVYDATDRLIAAYLGQEGMEIVRNIRDSNWLNIDAGANASWLDGLSDDAINYSVDCHSIGCEADYLATNLATWSDRYLFLKNGIYSYDQTGSPTKFKRKIKIEPLTDVDGSSNHIIKVIVETSWDQKGTIFSAGNLASDCNPANCVTIVATLYDWYNYSLNPIWTP